MANRTEIESGGPISKRAKRIIRKHPERNAAITPVKGVNLNESLGEVLVIGNDHLVTGVRGRKIRIKSC